MKKGSCFLVFMRFWATSGFPQPRPLSLDTPSFANGLPHGPKAHKGAKTVSLSLLETVPLFFMGTALKQGYLRMTFLSI